MAYVVDWCTVGPGGAGYFWGSHGCTNGNHTDNPHIHACTLRDFDDNGEPVGEVHVCSEIDDRTGMVRWNGEGDFDYHYDPGWWQGGSLDDRTPTAIFTEET